MVARKTKKLPRKERVRKSSNFYSIYNEKWSDDTQMPNTETRITQAYFIQEEINKELNEIITTQDGPMHDILSSWQSTEGHIPEGISSNIQIMMSMASTADISTRIGWMNRYGISSPLVIYIQGDPRDHKRCRVFIEEGSPRIGSPDYWQYPEYKGHRAAYARYVKRLSQIFGLPAALLGYSAEREFAGVYPNYVERTKRQINMFTWAELCNEYRVIDWPALFTSWGLPADKLPDLVYNITSEAYVHHLQTRMERWNIARWRGWFSLIAIQNIAGCCAHGPIRTAWFDYTQRYLKGAVADVTPDELRFSMIRALMPNTLGKLWIKKYCAPTLRHHVGTIVENIRSAAIVALNKTGWMAESTRTTAIRKLRKMNIQICSPDVDKWETRESACGLTSDNFMANLLTLSKLNTDFNQKLLLEGTCRNPSGNAWDKPVYEVNAYYYPEENRFLLPAAILRKPFYDQQASMMWNYGAIGSTIGHELCHAFDSDGRKYDEEGDQRDWWSTHDDREYKRKSRQVVKLYESRQYRGKNVDGELTLYENIADLGGLEFALAGLRRALGRKLTKDETREFFKSYAVSWRSKDRLKRAGELLVTDPHAPPKLRVNHAVRQMNEWYEAFDIGPESPEWIAPEKRIHFFA